MASRKVAPSDLTNAKLAAESAAADARTDAAPVSRPNVGELLRESRRRSGDDERALILLKRCQDAAALELRGANFSPDDRADVAADVLTRILAKCGPLGLPEMTDMRVSLTVCCGHVRNYRRAIEADRERDHKQFLESAAARAAAADAAAIELEREIGELRAATRPDDTDREARRILTALELSPDGPCHAVIYQWLRDASGPVCAAERGYSAGSWRVRVSSGGKLIRAAFPDAAAILAAVLPDDGGIIDARTTNASGETSGELIFATRDLSREAAGHAGTWSGKLIRDIAGQWREGTAAGARPVRPETADDARAVCAVSHLDDDAAGLASDAAARRHIAHTDRRTVIARGELRAVIVEDVTEREMTAAAIRAAGREHARSARGSGKTSAIKSAIPAAARAA